MLPHIACHIGKKNLAVILARQTYPNPSKSSYMNKYYWCMSLCLINFWEVSMTQAHRTWPSPANMSNNEHRRKCKLAFKHIQHEQQLNNVNSQEIHKTQTHRTHPTWATTKQCKLAGKCIKSKPIKHIQHEQQLNNVNSQENAKPIKHIQHE